MFNTLGEHNSPHDRGGLKLLQCAGFRTVGKTIAAAGAFSLDDLIHMVNVLHFRMDGELRTNFAAETASDTEILDDTHFHASELLRSA